MAERVCHGCGATMGFADPIPRDRSCESCGRDLRCCRNCRHWDEHASGECRETEAELVSEKWRRNFCEYFAWSPAPYAPDASASRAAEARARLDALLAGKPPASTKGPASEARAKLDALFRNPDPSKDDD